jgi:glycosyltransferase involved in cell wall biosynthesis
VESRKNHLLLYQVWERARESGVMLPDLVIVGRMGWAAADAVYAMKNDPTVRASIHLLNEVSDAQLEWLYANCLLTIYPSLYEGWGLPIAESLARGKVCLASSSSAMPEVAGDLVDYFSPYDAGECLRLVERYLDPAVLAARVRQMREQYPVTRWDDTVRQLEAALHRLSQ